MKRIFVSNEKDWDEFRLTKLVSRAGKYKCLIDIVCDRRYINMKSIYDMMEFSGRLYLEKNLEICVDGEDEEEAALWIKEYVEN